MNLRPVLWIGIIWIGLALILSIPRAFAETFHVTDGIELHDALVAASANGEDDTINLAEGVYDRHHDDPSRVDAGFQYAPFSTTPQSLTVRAEPGARPDQVILDGHHAGFVLRINDWYREGSRPFEALPSIHIDGLTLKNGGGRGLELIAESHHVTVKNCRIMGNAYPNGNGRGAGAYIRTGHGILIFENNLVIGNRLFEVKFPTYEGTELRCEGGGAYIYHSGEQVIVRNNVIALNSCEGENGIGGGLYLDGFALGLSGLTWNVSHNTIIQNTARSGSGLFVFPHGVLNLFNNILHGNTSPVTDTDATDLMAVDWGPNVVHAQYNNLGSVDTDFAEDEGNLAIEPRFVNLYHLPADSALVDGGTDRVISGLLASDYEGDPRSCGEFPDIGADEYCGGSGEPTSFLEKKGKTPAPSMAQMPWESDSEPMDVAILNAEATFGIGDVIHILCQPVQDSLNEPRMQLVDARDGRPVLDIPIPDAQGAASFLQIGWEIPDFVPGGEYALDVVQYGLVADLPSVGSKAASTLWFTSLQGTSIPFFIE